MNKIITKTVLTVALVLGVATQVGAHLLSPQGNLVIGANDNQADGGVADVLNANYVELWKWDQGDASLSGNGFNIQFIESNTKAVLSWDLTGLGTQLYAVAWKDGLVVDSTGAVDMGDPDNQGYYYSEVTDGQRLKSDGDTIQLTVDLSPAFVNATAWSHIAFYGTRGSTSVPDGGATLALIGIAMTGLGLLRRKMK